MPDRAATEDDTAADPAELTIRLITDAGARLPDVVTHMIELPRRARSPAEPSAVEREDFAGDRHADHASRAADRASSAADTRERKLGVGAELSEAARESREGVGRETAGKASER